MFHNICLSTNIFVDMINCERISGVIAVSEL